MARKSSKASSKKSAKSFLAKKSAKLTELSRAAVGLGAFILPKSGVKILYLDLNRRNVQSKYQCSLLKNETPVRFLREKKTIAYVNLVTSTDKISTINLIPLYFLSLSYFLSPNFSSSIPYTFSLCLTFYHLIFPPPPLTLSLFVFLSKTYMEISLTNLECEAIKYGIGKKEKCSHLE